MATPESKEKDNIKMKVIANNFKYGSIDELEEDLINIITSDKYKNYSAGTLVGVLEFVKVYIIRTVENQNGNT